MKALLLLSKHTSLVVLVVFTLTLLSTDKINVNAKCLLTNAEPSKVPFSLTLWLIIH